MPTHSTPALAHDEHEGKSWSHFVFLDRHLLQADIDLDIWPPAEPRRRGEEGAVNVGLWVVGEGMPEAGDCRFFGDGAPGTAFETAVWGGFGFMTDTLSVSGWVSGWVSVCGGGDCGEEDTENVGAGWWTGGFVPGARLDWDRLYSTFFSRYAFEFPIGGRCLSVAVESHRLDGCVWWVM